MRFSTVAVASTFFGLAVAEVFQVDVGKGNLTFSPEKVNAKVGDEIMFVFHPKNHTITQSSFAKPCDPIADAISTPFTAVDATATEFPTWTFPITNDTKPLWFFCAQLTPKSHCQAGMVFSINPDKGKTPDGKVTSHEAYKANAMALAGSATGGPLPSPSGGVTGTIAATNSAASPSGTGVPGGAMAVGRNTVGVLAAAGMVLALVL